ncbi:MAG: hypothetical protein EAZ35_09375 [Sphingobacteriia bacterium]|nr:MAG: hypothetical protein EAZ35_09375 [Sphingobacteriia bacterium]
MKHFILVSILLINLIVVAQNVTINYQTWNPSSPPCNIFASATNATGYSNLTAAVTFTSGFANNISINKNVNKQIRRELLKKPVRELETA